MIQPFLKKITKNLCVQLGQTNVGVLFTSFDKDTVDVSLIDSTGCKTDAQKLYQNIIEYTKKTFCRVPVLKSIFMTHSHADHGSGCDFFAKKTGCKIFCSAKERAGLENSLIEPSIFCGCYPLPEILSNYFVIPPCKVDSTMKAGDEIEMEKIKITVTDLPGHYLEPLGFLCKDKEENKSAYFLGDSVLGRKNIAKHWVPYIYSIESFIKTLEHISKTKADFYVPGHGDLTSQIEPLCELNAISVLETQDAILQMLDSPKTFEQVLQKVANINNFMMTISQYVLVSSTVRSFLSCLYSQKKVNIQIRDNVLYYQKV